MKNVCRLILKQTGKIQLESGIQTIRAREIESADESIAPGDLVEILGPDKLFCGLGYFNHQSRIPLRILTRKKETIDEEFWMRRLDSAWKYRSHFYTRENSCRLVYGEADNLPGLVIDRYCDLYVVQITTAGMEKQSELLVKLLIQQFNPSCIILSCESLPRKKEGLPLYRKVVHGEYQSPAKIVVDDIVYLVDPMTGHKTGYFLDQRENRLFASKLCRDKHILDIFCYTGAFGIAAALNDARNVTFVDIHEPSIDLAKRNVNYHGISNRCKIRKAEAFQFLAETDEKYDLIFLDPPSFVRGHQRARRNMSNYRKLNNLALQCLAPEGILVSSNCSYYVNKHEFSSIIGKAQTETGRSGRIFHFGQTGPDHPHRAEIPDTDYLKCFFIQLDN